MNIGSCTFYHWAAQELLVFLDQLIPQVTGEPNSNNPVVGKPRKEKSDTHTGR